MPYMRAYAERDDNGLAFVASTEAEARDGLVIKQDHWLLDNYRANPVFLWVHDYTTLPLGRLEVAAEGGQLRARVAAWREAPFPQEVRQAYETGFLNATSVGWDNVTAGEARRRGYGGIPDEAADDDVYHELLDISAVPVPGDPSALVERQRAAVAALLREVVGEPVAEPDGQRPFPGEHACRLREPDDFEPDSFRRMERETEDGKAFVAIMGRLTGEDAMTLQSHRYPAADWSEADAKAQCEMHKGLAFEPATAEDAEPDATPDVDPGERESERESWEDVAAAMVDVLSQTSEDPDKTRRRRYNALLPRYRRLGKVPPEWMTGDDLRALGPDEWRGLWLEGELERVGKVLSARNVERVQQASDLLREVLASAETIETPPDRAHDPAVSELARWRDLLRTGD